MKSKLAVVLVSLTLLLISSLSAQEQTGDISRENNLKSYYIYNFLQYVQWPDTTISDNYVIDILGEDSLVFPLKKIAGNKTVEGKNLIVVTRDNINKIGNSHILFISSSQKNQLEEIKKLLRHISLVQINGS